jgi:hypothetical protein
VGKLVKLFAFVGLTKFNKGEPVAKRLLKLAVAAKNKKRFVHFLGLTLILKILKKRTALAHGNFQ